MTFGKELNIDHFCFKLVLLYTRILCGKKRFSYIVHLLYFCAHTIFATKAYKHLWPQAKMMFQEFLKGFANIYGREHITSRICRWVTRSGTSLAKRYENEQNERANEYSRMPNAIIDLNILFVMTRERVWTNRILDRIHNLLHFRESAMAANNFFGNLKPMSIAGVPLKERRSKLTKWERGFEIWLRTAKLGRNREKKLAFNWWFPQAAKNIFQHSRWC